MERDFLIFIWQNRLFKSSNLVFSNGQKYEIISCGLRFSACDFVHAVLKNEASSELIRGTVRLDALSSDWNAHSLPDAGSGVIAHVVVRRDAVILVGGAEMLTCTLTPTAKQLGILKSASENCSRWLCETQNAEREMIFERLVVERLKRKSDHIASFAHANDDWSEAAYVSFMGSLGYGNKRVAFEQLAVSLPLHYLERHFYRAELLEALLLGQAGFLNVRNPDTYTEILQNEYNAARKANSLLCPPLNWTKAGVRAHSSPAISLARAAHILSGVDDLLTAVISTRDIDHLRDIFRVSMPDYWADHYAPSCYTTLKGLDVMSEAKINLLLINFVVPLLAAYGYQNGDHYVSQAIDILEQVTPESNTYTRSWGGFKCRSAYVSQALIELKTQYCGQSGCARCPLFGSSAIGSLR